MTTRIAGLLVLSVFLAGCYTQIRAPGAVGKIVDAESGAPVRGAQITRRDIAGGIGARMGVPPEGLPTTSVLSDKGGRFDLAPATHTDIAFMISLNPESISGSFVISADGYITNELEGLATSRTRWRVNLRRVLLKRS